MYNMVQSDITSKNTSINSKKLPAIYNRLDWDALREHWAKITKFEHSPIVLDFGCGRYTDHIEHFLATKGFIFRGYDPFWKNSKENNEALACKPYIVICSNVLNVISNDIILNELQNKIRNFSFSVGLDKKQSLYYISIYAGRGDGIGKITKEDCYQRNQKINEYKLSSDYIRKNTITSKIGKDFLL